MASKVEIANRALTKIGEARILSLSDDVEAARSVDSLWDIVRDAELRIRKWKFSVSRDALAALASTPSWGYSYEYQLPSDCLRILQVNDVYPGVSLSNYRSMDETEWRVEGRKILTDIAAPLKVRYIARVEDTGQWDSAFTEAFACRLAVELAERLTQSNTKRELAWEEYKIAISMAVRADAIEGAPEPLPDDSWVLSRL
jgi:hypothetical protein